MSSGAPMAPLPPGNITIITYTETSTDDDSSLDSSLVAFIVIGSVLLCTLVILAAILFKRYKSKRRNKGAPNAMAPPMPFAPPPVPVSLYPNSAPAMPVPGEAPRVELPPVRVVEGQSTLPYASNMGPMNMGMSTMGMGTRMNMNTGEGVVMGGGSMTSTSGTPVQV